MGINQDQNMRFKLRSLFRSLIIIVDNHATQGGAERVVHLVRTDLSELRSIIDRIAGRGGKGSLHQMDPCPCHLCHVIGHGPSMNIVN